MTYPKQQKLLTPGFAMVRCFMIFEDSEYHSLLYMVSTINKSLYSSYSSHRSMRVNSVGYATYAAKIHAHVTA